MIIVMKDGASKQQIEHVFDKVKELGFSGSSRSTANSAPSSPAWATNAASTRLQRSMCSTRVENVVPILKPFKLASSRMALHRGSSITIPAPNGGDPVVSAAAILWSWQARAPWKRANKFLLSAEQVKKAGARVLAEELSSRRTSRIPFQGLEEEGLKLLAEAREKSDCSSVTEVITPDRCPLIAEYRILCRSARATCRISPS